jgi:uncharacterized protein (TIGR02996 family)
LQDHARQSDRSKLTMLEDLLLGIVADPQDEDRWLVLANYLDQHDDPRRAELLRLHRKLLATRCEPGKHAQRAALQARIVELLEQGVRPCVPQRTVLLGRRLKIPMTFSWVPPGAFLRSQSPERPHPVEVSCGFWLGVHPVTQAQWRWATRREPSSLKGADDHPVERETWHDCQMFCHRLGERTGRRFRLPTEAEWEYACRAGTTTRFFFGETLSTDHANYEGRDSAGKVVRRQGTTRVGTFPPNAWGLFDMHGNVFEWCEDRYSWDYGPDAGTNRVLRGGGWYSDADYCGSDRRNHREPDYRSGFGCRLVLCPDGQGP